MEKEREEEREREREGERRVIHKSYSGTNVIDYMSENELAFMYLGVFTEHNTPKFSHA